VLANNINQILKKRETSPSNSLLQNALAVILRQRFSLLLGYYADMLFLEHNEAFIFSMQFLFESVSFGKNTIESVIALQSIDSLSTVVSDGDLAPRLTSILPDIVKILC
jgi:hypothetical protein